VAVVVSGFQPDRQCGAVGPARRHDSGGLRLVRARWWVSRCPVAGGGRCACQQTRPCATSRTACGTSTSRSGVFDQAVTADSLPLARPLQRRWERVWAASDPALTDLILLHRLHRINHKRGEPAAANTSAFLADRTPSTSGGRRPVAACSAAGQSVL